MRFNLSPINTNSIAFDRGHSTLWTHFSLGIVKFDTLSNLLLTPDGMYKTSLSNITYIVIH